MPYLLKHHFDPGFDFHNLKPMERPDGSVDHYNLGYVKNVLPGDLLAEWVEIPPQGLVDQGGGEKPVISADRSFPAGDNVAVDSGDKGRLLAAAKGYPYYDENGNISVKTLLNVRSDVDFHTGNIHFLGNVVIHGDVRSGFQVLGGNVLVRGCVDASLLRAEESLVAESGIKGGGQAVLKAGVDMRLPFAENALLLAGRRMQVETACMHCEIYAGRRLSVRGRLVGGTTWCTDIVYVGESLGGAMATETEIVLGYSAIMVNKAHLVETQIKETMARLKTYREHADKDPELAEEFAPKIASLESRLAKFRDKRRQIWDGITASENLEVCRVVVPGRVRPGVEIFMGPARLAVDDEMHNVCFHYQDGEIVVSSPAMKGNKPNC